MEFRVFLFINNVLMLMLLFTGCQCEEQFSTVPSQSSVTTEVNILTAIGLSIGGLLVVSVIVFDVMCKKKIKCTCRFSKKTSKYEEQDVVTTNAQEHKYDVLIPPTETKTSISSAIIPEHRSIHSYVELEGNISNEGIYVIQQNLRHANDENITKSTHVAGFMPEYSIPITGSANNASSYDEPGKLLNNYTNSGSEYEVI